MRISDWSSDVCSSDLRSGEAAVGEHAARAVPGEALVVAVGDRIFKRAHVEVEGESGGASANGEDRGVEHRGQHGVARHRFPYPAVMRREELGVVTPGPLRNPAFRFDGRQLVKDEAGPAVTGHETPVESTAIRQFLLDRKSTRLNSSH